MSKGASGTTTSTGSTTPWTDQQPYLNKIFKEADTLYSGTPPQYYPDSTYAPLRDTQQDAIYKTIDLGKNGSPITGTSGTAANDILGGSSIRNNPGLTKLNDLMELNPGTNNAGTNYLTDVTGTNPATASTNYNSLETLGSKNYGVDNVGGDTLSNYSKTNYGSTAYNEGAKDQQSIASGDRLKTGNTYTKDLTDSILADVIPAAQSSFISGGMLSSPEASRATAAGAAAGLAPSLFKQYQYDEGQQLTAAQNLAENQLKGGTLSTDSATQYGKLNLGGIGEERLAADAAVKDFLTGTGQQQTAATTLGDQATKGYTAQTTAAADASSGYEAGVGDITKTLGLAPDLQKMPYTDLTQEYSAGALLTKDDQAKIDDAVARWNYGQTLPYESLNALTGTVTGNYGGSTTLTQPFFDNSTSASSLLGTAASGASLLSSGASLLSLL